MYCKQGVADDTNTLAFRDNWIRNKVCRVAMPKILSNSIYNNGDIVFDHRRSKRELVQEMMFVNMCVKFCDNRIKNKKAVKFDVDLVFDHRRLKRKLIQEMMFVNTCVKFCDNRIRNKKAVKFDVDLIFDCRRSKRELAQEMMFVNTCVKFRNNQIRNKKSVKICQI